MKRRLFILLFQVFSNLLSEDQSPFSTDCLDHHQFNLGVGTVYIHPVAIGIHRMVSAHIHATERVPVCHLHGDMEAPAVTEGLLPRSGLLDLLFDTSGVYSNLLSTDWYPRLEEKGHWDTWYQNREKYTQVENQDSADAVSSVCYICPVMDAALLLTHACHVRTSSYITREGGSTSVHHTPGSVAGCSKQLCQSFYLLLL